MKNYKLPLLGIALVLLITSCKKEDVRPVNTTGSSALIASKTGASGWNSLSSWSTSKSDNATTYFTSLTDTTITADVARSGLVLVFKKSGTTVQSLPFQDQATNTYWYYQVSKDAVRINGDNSESGRNYSGQVFSYFVFSAQQIADLGAKGKTKFDLMQLNYDQVLALFK